MTDNNVGVEHLSKDEKEEIVEDRYWDIRISHWIAVFMMTVGLATFLYFTPSEKIQAFSPYSFPVVMFFMLLSLIHLAKGIAGKVAEKLTK